MSLRFRVSDPLVQLSEPTQIRMDIAAKTIESRSPVSLDITTSSTMHAAKEPRMQVDSISSGISALLVANILQRGIGFVRNIAFCHFLVEEQLGLWALVSGFFVLAAPLAVLGLPGTLGRFSDVFRLQRRLASYVSGVTLGSGIGTVVIVGFLVVSPLESGELIFGEPQSLMTMIAVAGTLLTVIAFNVCTELLSGLRQNRSVSKMQVVNSLSFTVLSCIALAISSDWRYVLASFAAASVLGLLVGLKSLRQHCAMEFVDQCDAGSYSIWSRVWPLAINVWILNLLSNLFDLVDRYMLLHLANVPGLDGKAVVGQFHSGRILPVLITSLALMLNGMILPHLSAAWEEKDFDRVRKLMTSSFKLMALLFWSISVAGMVIAPWLFIDLLGGRYADGLGIMPMALMHCLIAALALLLQNYLMCNERSFWITVLFAVGLTFNIALNFVLVPTYSIYGAMFSTLASCIAVFLITLWIIRLYGFRLGTAPVVLAILPMSILISTELSMIVLTVAFFAISRTDWLLDRDEKASIISQLHPFFNRLGLNANEACFRQI